MDDWSTALNGSEDPRGASESALDALDRLAEATRPAATDWVAGIEARSRAFLDEGKEAESQYPKAIHRLGRTALRGEPARAHLLCGEWSRRERRGQAAREHLTIAHELFAEKGMEGFARRAARELVATGGGGRKRTNRSRGEPTAQEMRA
ncbi:hypothetical protein ACF07T_16920 [Streptomyces sp. NPDC015184]|uniref:hypothetical protein n=1 Tax=Streptomyces sp. NPDC015184 TaxID=3364946 RepID=UPI0037010352